MIFSLRVCQAMFFWIVPRESKQRCLLQSLIRFLPSWISWPVNLLFSCSTALRLTFSTRGPCWHSTGSCCLSNSPWPGSWAVRGRPDFWPAFSTNYTSELRKWWVGCLDSFFYDTDQEGQIWLRKDEIWSRIKSRIQLHVYCIDLMRNWRPNFF